MSDNYMPGSMDGSGIYDDDHYDECPAVCDLPIEGECCVEGHYDHTICTCPDIAVWHAEMEAEAYADRYRD